MTNTIHTTNKKVIAQGYFKHATSNYLTSASIDKDRVILLVILNLKRCGITIILCKTVEEVINNTHADDYITVYYISHITIYSDYTYTIN